MADPSKIATAVITLLQAVTVSLSPSTASLASSPLQQFTATVLGTSNTALTWSINPVVGTISSAGLYTAPANISASQSVTVTAQSVADPTKSASAGVTIAPVVGATYYLAPAADGGSDSNSGTSAAKPWLTPNHALNCGDVILAAASTAYSAANFTHGHWGNVTCRAGNNVAWLKCAIFDKCKISTSTESGMWVDNSYWGVQGWEITATSPSDAYGDCIQIAPGPVTPVEIHHIILANNVFNVCSEFGVGTYNQGFAGVDYLALVGNIAYKTSGTASYVCGSGFSVNQPVLSDTLPGTHIYLGGNFAWGSFNANPCGGGKPTDGNGIVIDTPAGVIGGVQFPYQGQIVVDNNLLVANGGRGLEVYANSAGTGPFASIYFLHNTMWGNNGDLTQNGTYCGEMLLNAAFNTQAFLNLAVTAATTGCGANPIYAYYVGSSATTTDLIYQNWGYAASGTNAGIANSTGFSYGPINTFGTNPNFAHPVAPGAPNCGGAASVPACMADVIANFTPTNAAGYGYQTPSTTSVYDPLFPQWLCNVDLPTGLISMGCQTGQ
jgi:hypothetical protein